jgi:hypothetical protein
MKTGKVGTNDAVQSMRRYSGMPSREYESAYGNTRGCYTAKCVRRMLPMSPRVRALLERRWEAAKMPSEGWVWATATASVQHRSFDGEETTPAGAEAQWSVTLRALRSPAYLPHAAWGSGLRCLDSGADRGPLFHRHVRPVRSPQPRCGDEHLFPSPDAERTAPRNKIGWLQIRLA